MGIFKNKENYLKALCTAHPLVAHGTVVDGVARKSFFRFNNEEELAAATANGINYPCVGYMHFDGRMTDQDNALVDIRHVIKNGWVFLDTVDPNVLADGTGGADLIQDAYDLAFMVMEDFIKAMKDEFEENEKCGVFFNFDLNKINYVPVGPNNQNEYGWMLYFDDEFPATRVIDGTMLDWNSGVTILNTNEPEIIIVTNEDTKVVNWTSTRKLRFGSFPVIEVWLRDETNVLYLAAVQPILDGVPPAFNVMTFIFSGNQNGFIVIK